MMNILNTPTADISETSNHVEITIQKGNFNITLTVSKDVYDALKGKGLINVGGSPLNSGRDLVSN
ncbi:hypothetical protein KL86SPO_50226 [uncultured Sporomusa sp.]|uniref:Uncharacterized protein n=1 Tax=uncultured Sporomusa sp. TaxID=307249 RepID=A0A212LY07_9FIRM|nr:hypothetical protein [uncultured Sporomusa sp.]SCM82455.1 hypothetical protein KL86SPO_50226 [uncultured Sporomusa sp.]